VTIGASIVALRGNEMAHQKTEYCKLYTHSYAQSVAGDSAPRVCWICGKIEDVVIENVKN
jgi:hypothetical protein